MTTAEHHVFVTRLLDNYLVLSRSGPWTVHGACITASIVRGSGVPADAVVRRIIIEEPDQGWTVAVETAHRGRTIWRSHVHGYYDDSGTLSQAGVQAAYADWLGAL